MRNFRSTIAATLSLVLCLLSTAAPPAARACPMPPPSPLRLLFMESKLVVVARIGASHVESTQERNLSRLHTLHEDSISTALHVEQVIKGNASADIVNVKHSRYRNTARQTDDAQQPRIAEAAEVDTAVDAAEDEPKLYVEGETALIFLKQHEDASGYYVEQPYYGIKRLAPDDLKIYLARLDDLKRIIANNKANDSAQITEWLVACVEESATRMEGALELAPNPWGILDADEETEETSEVASDETQTTDDEPEATAGDEAATDEAEEVVGAEGAPVEQSDDAAIVDNEAAGAIEKTEEVESAEVNYRALLTPAQRERVAAALLGAIEINHGERLLVTLLAEWRDARLAPYLTERLRAVAADPPDMIEDYLTLVARAHNDSAAARLARNYNETAYPDAEKGETQTLVSQRRADLLRRFIARIDTLTQDSFAQNLPATESATLAERK